MGLYREFGGYTEGMAAPSMERRLAERFGTTSFAVRHRVRLGEEELEVDASPTRRTTPAWSAWST